MISAEKVINIKVIELINIYNFYFGYFFIWQSVSKHCSQIHRSLIVSWTIWETCYLWTMFTITLLDKEITKIKVVDLDELYIFDIHHFFGWNHLVFQNLVITCHFFKFKKLNCSNFVKRKEWSNQHSNLIGHDVKNF